LGPSIFGFIGDEFVTSVEFFLVTGFSSTFGMVRLSNLVPFFGLPIVKFPGFSVEFPAKLALDSETSIDFPSRLTWTTGIDDVLLLASFPGDTSGPIPLWVALVLAVLFIMGEGGVGEVLDAVDFIAVASV